MELEGLKRCFKYLDQHNISVKTFVSDRHTSIAKWMRTDPDRKDITNHYFDLWHIAKGLSKKLLKLSKCSGCEIVRPWMRSIKRHLYWCVLSTKQGYGKLVVAKWQSVIRHIANVHTDHNSPLFPNCLHDKNIEDRLWIPQGNLYHVFVIESLCCINNLIIFRHSCV